MKKSIRAYLLAISFFVCNCSNNETEISQPEFLDNGKTIDSLKKVYNCESINYENWGDKKATDSCLTVCLINSSKVPTGSTVDSHVDQLEEIALAIKKALRKPQTYKTFYIIFVKKETINGIETKDHSGGMEIPSNHL